MMHTYDQTSAPQNAHFIEREWVIDMRNVDPFEDERSVSVWAATAIRSDSNLYFFDGNGVLIREFELTKVLGYG